MKNIEVKSTLPNKQWMLERLNELSVPLVWTRFQSDIFLETGQKDTWLKIRMEEEQSPVLVGYKRTTSHSGSRESSYCLADVSEDTIETLTHALKTVIVVDKVRSYYLMGHTRIHIDSVEGFYPDSCDFIELETFVERTDFAEDIALAEETVKREALMESALVISRLRLDPANFISVPYAELLLARKGK